MRYKRHREKKYRQQEQPKTKATLLLVLTQNNILYILSTDTTSTEHSKSCLHKVNEGALKVSHVENSGGIEEKSQVERLYQ